MSTSSLVLNPAAITTVTRVRWKIFLLLLMLTSINYIDRASLSVAMPLMSKEFDLDPAMRGLVIIAGVFMIAHRVPIISAAARNNAPAVYQLPQFVRDGGLLSYGSDGVVITRRAATYV